MAETGDRNDPYSGFNFLIEITDVYPKGSDIVAGFSEVSGLATETDILESRTGNAEITVRKLPGLRKVTNMTLNRGITQGRHHWEWRNNWMTGRTERTYGANALLNEA